MRKVIYKSQAEVIYNREGNPVEADKLIAKKNSFYTYKNFSRFVEDLEDIELIDSKITRDRDYPDYASFAYWFIPSDRVVICWKTADDYPLNTEIDNGVVITLVGHKVDIGGFEDKILKTAKDHEAKVRRN